MDKNNTNGSSVQPMDTCTNETVGFLGGMEMNVVSRETATDPTLASERYDYDFNKFLHRTVKLAEYEWQPGDTLGFTIDPWSLWANHAIIKGKLDNFKLFRCKNLKLTFVINTNRFNYGGVITDYYPLLKFGNMPIQTSISIGNKSYVQGMMAASNRMHQIFDMSDSKSACMCLPFMFPFDYLDVTNSDYWTSMGTINIRSMTEMANGQGDTQSAFTMTVFAEMEDVKVGGVTSVLAVQAGPGEDEVEEASTTGIVSAPATAIANVAGKLKDVPIIGPFATATQIAAKATAGIASIFGYGAPPNISSPSFMMRQPGIVAPTMGGTDNVPLTLDPKAGVTVDPRVTGVVDNDTNVLSLSRRWSIYNYATWDIADEPGHEVFWSAVTPSMMWPADAGTGTSFAVQHTNISYMAAPFDEWRGNLKFRFQIFANQIHRGRLRITFDPNSLAAAQDGDYPTNLTWIIDLAEKKVFEIEVPYMQVEPYCLVPDPVDKVYSSSPVSGFFGSQPPDNTTNGFISVKVLNPLTGSQTGAVTMYVSIAASADYDLQAPYSQAVEKFEYFPNPPFTSLQREPLVQAGDFGESTEDDDPAQLEGNMASSGESVKPQLPLVFFGEAVHDILALTKRYSFSEYMALPYSLLPNTTPGTNGGAMLRRTWLQSNYPITRGYDNIAGHWHFATTNDTYNLTTNTMLNYFSTCYVGRRGSIRHKVVKSGDSWVNNASPSVSQNTKGPVDYVRVYRDPDSSNPDGPTSIIYNGGQAPADLNNSRMWSENVFHGNEFNGALTSIIRQQGYLSYVTPYYSTCRFQPNVFMSHGKGQETTRTNRSRHQIEDHLLYNGDSNCLANNGYVHYVAAGDDYTLHFYNGPPLVFYKTDGSGTIVDTQPNGDWISSYP